MADLFQHAMMIVKSGNGGNSFYSDRRGAKNHQRCSKLSKSLQCAINLSVSQVATSALTEEVCMPAKVRSKTKQPLVGIIMGSTSDWETMSHAAHTLDALRIPHETRVVSAHRTPDLLFAYASQAEQL